MGHAIAFGVVSCGMLAVAQLEPDRPPPSEEGDASAAAADRLPSILLAAAVVLLIVVVLGKSRRKAITKSQELSPTPKERIAELRHRAEGDAGIEARVAQAADQIRELTAVLDTRIATLDALIQQADERIDRLNSEPRSDRPRNTVGNGAASESPTADAQKRAIYELADQGLSPAEIASRLSQHSGKVELILALRRV